jgi:hypothetical protein
VNKPLSSLLIHLVEGGRGRPTLVGPRRVARRRAVEGGRGRTPKGRPTSRGRRWARPDPEGSPDARSKASPRTWLFHDSSAPPKEWPLETQLLFVVGELRDLPNVVGLKEPPMGVPAALSPQLRKLGEVVTSPNFRSWVSATPSEGP